MDDRRPEATTREELKCEKLRLEIEGMRKQGPPWLKAAQPFFLVMATAIISGIVVPDISRRAQVNEKELEIKTALAGDIGRAVAAFVNEIQSFEVDKVHAAGKNGNFQAVNAAYKQWVLDESVIAAKMEAYFPTLAAEWKAYARALEEAYALTGTADSSYRRQRIEVLRSVVPAAAIDWGTLVANGGGSKSLEEWRPYETAWFRLRDALYQTRDQIVRKLLQANSTLS